MVVNSTVCMALSIGFIAGTIACTIISNLIGPSSTLAGKNLDAAENAVSELETLVSKQRENIYLQEKLISEKNKTIEIYETIYKERSNETVRW